MNSGLFDKKKTTFMTDTGFLKTKTNNTQFDMEKKTSININNQITKLISDGEEMPEKTNEVREKKVIYLIT